MTPEDFIHCIAGTTYYRLLSKTDPQDIIYVSCTIPFRKDKICDYLGLVGYTTDIITEEEFQKETQNLNKK